MSDKPVFEMVALHDVTMDGVQFRKGDTFNVADPATVRWLIKVQAAMSKSALEAASSGLVEVENSNPGGNIPAKQGTSNGNEAKARATPPKRGGLFRR